MSANTSTHQQMARPDKIGHRSDGSDDVGSLPGAPDKRQHLANAKFSTFIDHFENVVAEFADMCAVETGGESLTYRELDRRANVLAGRLLHLRCQADTLVVVCVERSNELLAALLAVLKAGAAFLPLDPQFPAERWKAILKQSGARVVFTQTQYAAAFDDYGLEVIDVRLPPLQTGHWKNEPSGGRWLDPSCLAYVMYTSGSTGTPKGVAVSQESFYQYILSARDYYGLERGGLSIAHTSIGFDLSLTALFCPLLAGMKVVMVPDDDGIDGVLQKLDEPGTAVSLLKLTPTHLRLMEEARRGKDSKWNCSVLVVGGEKLKAEDVRFWERQCGWTRIFNEYGPTEATVGCCAGQVTSEDALEDGSVPIGSGVAGAFLYIDGQPRTQEPMSREGELSIAGRCLARGYLNAPAWTAEKFTPHPHSAGQRIYRSGDLVKTAASGEAFVFIGRRDRQCKINGVRVEIEEIEAILTQYPGVRAAAVAPIRGAEKTEFLAAFLSLGDQEREVVEISSLLAYLKTRIFHPVIPKSFYVVGKLPLSKSGKLDYSKLVRERRVYAQLKEAFAPPRNPLEELLASLWREILNVEEVGIDDSFFALDGNSMKSIQFIYEAKKHNLMLSTKDLFERQTIRSLAELLRSPGDPNRIAAHLRPAAFALVSGRDRERMPADVMDAYPLALLQAGTLFESDHRRGSGVYHNVNSYHIACEWNPAVFESSLVFVMRRHPILRTSYNYVDFEKPLQLVHNEVKIPFHIRNISHLPESDQEKFLEAFIEEESNTPFDWTRPPLLRFFIHLRGPRRLQFTLSKHHSILDGWSAATLITEIMKNYFAMLRAETPPFQLPLETTYKDYVALELQALQSSECRDFWTEALRTATYHPLQAWCGDRPRPDCAHSAICTRGVEIDQDLSARLKELARRAQVPLKSVLLAIHLRVLAQMTGARRVTTGMVSHGRSETADADRAIGLFINTVPFHIAIEERFTWLDLIQRVFREERRIFPYQRYPMARIKSDVGWERLFDSIFYYTNFQVFRDFRNSADLTFLGSKGFEETETPFTVAFSLHPLTSAIGLNLHFHVDHFSEAQIEHTRSYFINAMNAMSTEPERPLFLRPILTEAEVRLSRSTNSNTTLPQAAETIFDFVCEQAGPRADVVALSADGEAITYGAALRRAEELADRLRDCGVSTESIVGIHLGDIVGVILAMLAVNRAGGCFVILDVQWPVTRLNEILKQIDPGLILTEAGLASRVAGWHGRVLEMTAAIENPRVRPFGYQNQGRTRDDLAYIMMTSGSTGKPKGAMVSNGNLYYSTWSRLRHYDSAYERFLLLSRLTFDSAFAGVFGTLCGGGTLHLMRESDRVDVSRVAHVIAEESISHFLAIPSLYRVLLPELSPDRCVSLQSVIVAGEELTGDLVQSHQQRMPAVKLHNEYGPTEGTVWATVAEIGEMHSKSAGGVTIGRSIPGVETLVLDATMRPAAFGVAGELYIAGVGVGRGYRKAPGATAQRFIPNPYPAGETGSSVLYRTGDLVRYLPDGQLQFVGRADHQLKVRGVRIEPEEIEKVFHECFDLREAMAAVREDIPGRKRMCLYYVACHESAPVGRFPGDIAEVREMLGEKLPAYMLPDEVIEVESLPKLRNNKLDRKSALALVAISQEAPKRALDQPSSEIERALWGIWREVLGVTGIGVRQNFFQIGGDSLSANQVVLKTEKLFGVKLLMKDFYQSPTIAAHAHLLKLRSRDISIDFDKVASIWNKLN